MRISHLPLFTVLVLGSYVTFPGQTRKAPGQKNRVPAPTSNEIGQKAVVIDETLSVLRAKPSLFAEPIQRMRRGRKVQIQAVTEADGVKFYKVTAPPTSFGWVQSEAVFGKFRAADEQRLAALVQASTGFEQLEVATEFLNLFGDSTLRPSILLLFGDLMEETAAKLSRDALSKLSRKEMAATAAPLHSYYLNFVSLDRYRKLGVTFRFNTATRQFHYDGQSWRELVAKYPASPEAIEAKKRLDSAREKLVVPATIAN
jgi:hypothetical protein